MLHIFNNDGILGVVNNDNFNKNNFNGVVKIDFESVTVPRYLDKHQNGAITVQSFGNIITRNNETDIITKIL